MIRLCHLLKRECLSISRGDDNSDEVYREFSFFAGPDILESARDNEDEQP